MKQLFFFISILTLVSCSKVYQTTGTSYQLYDLKDASTSPADIEAIINPYKSQLDSEMNAEIAQCTNTLSKTQPESDLGNWMCDALLAETNKLHTNGVDIAIQNYGGIRIPTLAEGNVTRGEIFELMPFENRIVVLEMNGVVLNQLFNHIASLGGWPVSKGVKYQIKNGTLHQFTLNDAPIDNDKIYTVSISDYIANGGDNCFFLKDLKRTTYQKLIRDSMFDYIASNPEISASIEGRTTIVE